MIAAAQEEGDDDYDSLILEYEELIEELELINSVLDYPIGDEPLELIELREALLKKIRDIRDRLGLTGSFDTTIGYDPLKVYRLCFLSGEDDWLN